MELINKLIEAGFVFISWAGRYGGGVQAALVYSEEHAEKIANDFTAGDQDYSDADKYFNIPDYPFAHGDSFTDVIDLIEDKLSKFTPVSMMSGGDYINWLALYCCNYKSYPGVSDATDPLDPAARVPAPTPILTSPEDLAFLSTVKERQANTAVDALLAADAPNLPVTLPELKNETVDELFDQLYAMCAYDAVSNDLGNFVGSAVFTEEELADPAGPDQSVQMAANIAPATAYFGKELKRGWQLTVVRFGQDLSELARKYPETHIRFLHYSDGKIVSVVAPKISGTA